MSCIRHSQITQVFITVIKAVHKASAWLRAINLIILQWAISTCALTAHFESMQLCTLQNVTHNTNLNQSNSFKRTYFEFDEETCFFKLQLFYSLEELSYKWKLVYYYGWHCDKNHTHCRNVKFKNEIFKKVFLLLSGILLQRHSASETRIIAYHKSA